MYRILKRTDLVERDIVHSRSTRTISQGYRRHPSLVLRVLQLVTILVATAVYYFVVIVFGRLGLHIVNNFSSSATLRSVALQPETWLLPAAVIFLVWCIWPRAIGYPPAFVLADEEEFPALNAVVREIAQRIGVEPPAIFMTERYGAAFARLGWRRRLVIQLGHPLLSILSPSELIMLITHEMSHARDAAWTRTLYVRVALGGLVRWVHTFHPLHYRVAIPMPIRIALSVLLLPIWLPGWCLYMLIKLCTCADHRDAELWADYVSQQLSGNRKPEDLFVKMQYGHLVELQKAYDEAPAARKYHTFIDAADKVEDRVREQLLTSLLAREFSPFAMHPPTPERLEALETSPHAKRAIHVSPTAFQALHNELLKWPRVMERREAELDD